MLTPKETLTRLNFSISEPVEGVSVTNDDLIALINALLSRDPNVLPKCVWIKEKGWFIDCQGWEWDSEDMKYKKYCQHCGLPVVKP